MPMQAPLAHLLNPRHRTAWRRLLSLLVLVVAWFAFSSVTGSDPFEHVDKVKHVLAFGCLAVAASLGWAASRQTTFRIACALVLYGVFIEAVQFFIPGREASALDVAADAAGIAAGLLAVHAARRQAGRTTG
jgi:VanZ family protein